MIAAVTPPTSPNPIPSPGEPPHRKTLLLLDLFCGRGGWTRPALARGWDAIGVDRDDHGYPAQILLQTLPASLTNLRALRPDLVVASPPCEEFARHALPWITFAGSPSLELLAWSIALIGSFPCPVIVECSRFAARWVPGARFSGSYALWGDLPAILPSPPRRKAMQSGTNPARRAMIEPDLAGWLIDWAARKAER